MVDLAEAEALKVDFELPEGWDWATLGRISELIAGVGFPEELQGRVGLEFPFFKVGNLGEVASGEVLLSSSHSIDFATAKDLRARVIPPGAILFAKIGMAIRLRRRRQLGVPACIDNNLMAAVPSPAILPRYLLRVLETIDFWALSQATTVPSLRKSELEEVMIPVPPYGEQERIIATIEALLEQVDAARERLERVPKILKRFRQAVLAAACSGRLTEDWRLGNRDIDPASLNISRMQNSATTVRIRRGVPENVTPPDWFAELELPTTWACGSTAELLRSGVLIDVKDGNHGTNHPRS